MRRSTINLISPLAFGVALVLAQFASADTITLHSLSENTSTGVFTYAIQLDAAADVQNNDGFVIYDFAGLTSWSITGGLNSSQFELSSTPTSNTLNQSAAVDANGEVAAISNGLTFDDPAVQNLSFSYVGTPVPFLGATTAILTLDSSITGGLTTSVYASVDHSGPTQDVPYSYSANPILVPAPTSSAPLPGSFAATAALAGLLAVKGKKIVRAIA